MSQILNEYKEWHTNFYGIAPDEDTQTELSIFIDWLRSSRHLTTDAPNTDGIQKASWISTKEKMPLPGQKVLRFYCGRMDIGELVHKSGSNWAIDVDYWMGLPAPPSS